ncbi:MAG: hypothetical protein IKU24_02295, partial [Clostridia bacterium]|nr:hypothetical protein [Clostridia bacterium]
MPRPTEADKSYDYKVNGTSRREGTVVRVLENVSIERKIGKVLAGKELSQLIAQSMVPGKDLTEKEKNVLNTGAFNVDTLYFRTPDSNDKLTKVIGVDLSTYKVEAEAMIAGLLNSDAKWIPVKAYPVLANGNGAEFDLIQDGDKYVGTFECNETFSRVQVVYRLEIGGFETKLISDLANITAELQDDIALQKDALNLLYTKLHHNLKRLTLGALSVLDGVALGENAAESFAILKRECMISDSTSEYDSYSYLYQYLSEYEIYGLAYYYTGNNAANMQYQINLIRTHLQEILDDAEFKKFVEKDETFKELSSRVEEIMDILNNAHLEPVHELVDTSSSFIPNLLAEVQKEGETGFYSFADRIELETVLSAGAPDQTSFGVTIQIQNKNGAVIDSFTEEMFAQQGSPIYKEDFQEIYDRLFASIPNNERYSKYYTLTFAPPAQVVLGVDPVIITAAFKPVSYTVKIDGYDDQVLYAFDPYSITLPGTGDVGFKYIYNVAGKKIEVGSGSLLNYSLGTDIEAIAALFGKDRVLTITREKIDINKQDLLTFVDDLNKAVVNAGLLSGKNLELSFIPMQDANGNLSIVLRISKGDADLDIDALLAEILKIAAGINYVGLNGSTLFGMNADNELKLYLQTLIDFVTDSGLGLQTLTEIIDENGDLIETSIPGYTVIGADQHNNIVVNGAILNDVDQLGAKLIESTMQFGLSVNSNINVPFYVTLQD